MKPWPNAVLQEQLRKLQLRLRESREENRFQPQQVGQPEAEAPAIFPIIADEHRQQWGTW